MKDIVEQLAAETHQHFRFRVKEGVEQALAQIGLQVEARVVLAGFDKVDGAPIHVCAKPDDGPRYSWLPFPDSDWDKAVDELDPEREIVHRYLHFRGQRTARHFLGSRATDLARAIEESGFFEGYTFFASDLAPIGDYRVNTCIGVPTAELDALPALEQLLGDFDCHYSVRSLQHAVIDECLRRSDRAICVPNLEEELRPLGAAEDIVRAAAVRMTDAMVRRATEMPIDLFYAVDAFTSLGYERAGACGRLVIVDPGTAGIEQSVQFQRSISVHDARIMRKLLQLSDDRMAVLASDQGEGLSAYGLGVCGAAHDVVEIKVLDHAKWQLSINGSDFVQVAYGHATLPRRPLDFDEFQEVALRTVGSIDIERIWRIVEEVHASGHGMTIAVSDKPAAEIRRLGDEAMPLEPEVLDPGEVVRLGCVDGAVLLGPDGSCFGFGVILDGEADGSGDAARGSRFNSAVRYQTKMAAGSFLVVASDDGTLDLIPRGRGRRHKTVN